jgi:hypothetical protein
MTLHLPRLKQQAQIRRLPDQITINYGPREQLGRFFLAADKAARDRGVSLSLSTDFDYLRQINAANRRSWDSLAPSFNNEVSDIGEHNGFCLIGTAVDGTIVSTQAAKFYDLSDSSLAESVASFRFFYADPAATCEPGETCTLTSPSAGQISGPTVFSGSTWIHPDYRKLGLPAILPRISRALALTRWDTSYTISFVKFVLVEKGVARAYGYNNVEPALEWRGPSGEMRYEGALIWMNREELLADMARFPLLVQQADAPAKRVPQDAAAVSVYH